MASASSPYDPPSSPLGPPHAPFETDPTVRHSRIEGIIIFAAWASCLTYCCTYCYLFGYSTPERPLGPEDIRSIGGVPSWVVAGIFAPWLICSIFNIIFAGWIMADDDLGADRADELEAEIHASGWDLDSKTGAGAVHG